jgi:hypothetical protein
MHLQLMPLPARDCRSPARIPDFLSEVFNNSPSASVQANEPDEPLFEFLALL